MALFFWLISHSRGHPICEVSAMSYVSDQVRPQFESLSIDLKNEILRRDVQIHSLTDLMRCLQEIIDEGER